MCVIPPIFKKVSTQLGTVWVRKFSNDVDMAFSKDLKQEGEEPMINTKAFICYDIFCRWDSVWQTYGCSLSHLGSYEPINTNTM